VGLAEVGFQLPSFARQLTPTRYGEASQAGDEASGSREVSP
jgi:hypothetical protein